MSKLSCPGLALIAILALTACGSSSTSPSGSSSAPTEQSALSSSGYQSPLTESLSGGRRGG